MPDAMIAVSEKTIIELFEKVRDNFVFAKADSKKFWRFTAGYDIALHLANGSVDLRADNTIRIKELDIIWDRLNFSLGFDIPKICVGGFCIIPTPWGCALEAPEVCVFEDDPDVSLTIPLGAVIRRSEVSVGGSLVVREFHHPDRPTGMHAWDAQDHLPDSWADELRVHLDVHPDTVDLDPIDIADAVADLLEKAVEAVIDGLLGWLPDWAKDIIKGILGPIIDLIRWLLDLPDDIAEWLADLLNVQFDLFNILIAFVADYFAAKTPLLAIENPYPMLSKAENPNQTAGGPLLPDLIPVKIPIHKLSVRNTDKELIAELQLD